MSKAAARKLAPVPEPPGTVTVQVDGGTVTFNTELTGEDFLVLYRLSEVDTSDDGAVVQMYGPIMDLIERKTVSHTLGGPILRRPVSNLLAIWRAWNQAVQDRSLDPTSGSA